MIKFLPDFNEPNFQVFINVEVSSTHEKRDTFDPKIIFSSNFCLLPVKNSLVDPNQINLSNDLKLSHS